MVDTGGITFLRFVLRYMRADIDPLHLGSRFESEATQRARSSVTEYGFKFGQSRSDMAVPTSIGLGPVQNRALSQDDGR